MVILLSREIQDCILRLPALGQGSEAGGGAHQNIRRQCHRGLETESMSVAAGQLASKNQLPV